MSATTLTNRFASHLVNRILAIKPLANFAKTRARNMMIERAERLGVPWREKVKALRQLDWESKLAEVQDPNLTYPDYYLRSFHAYDEGNLNWDAALEVECAAYAVHSGIWPEAGVQGDAKLRQSYHAILASKIPLQPQDIADLGCGVGMSTCALKEAYPQASLVGIDLSPYFLTVARHNTEQRNDRMTWKHAPAEATGLPDESFDLVSACLMFHELPQDISKRIFAEALRLLRPGGYFAFMDMNPQSEVYAKMPPYILTLLKSTEPYLDRYFTLDVEQALQEAGFRAPTITRNSPRHRTVIAGKP